MRFSQFVFFVVGFLSLGFSAGQEEDPGVTRFREYLRINSAHPTPDYDGCIEWLSNQAEELGLDLHLEYYAEDIQEGDFALWMTWNGSNPQLKSILIDSHMDVVAADPSKWTHDPFAAYKDDEGNIFGRGTVDMKSSTMATLEAIRRLKAQGFVPLRTLHVSVLPDEELYSRGAKSFVNSTSFANLNVGFALDEAAGADSSSGDMFITYAEKAVWHFNYTVRGMAAHGSTLPPMTAGQKIQVVIDRLMEFRQTQLDLLDDPNYSLQNITTLNLVKLGGGLGNNIIPDELWASFDMRILTKPGWNLTDVEEMLDNIAQESGNDTTISYMVKAMDSEQTATDDTNIWWVVLRQTCEQLNTTCTPHIPSGVTDGRYIRNKGIPTFGLSTVASLPIAHQDDERVNERDFLRGIDRYEHFIKNFLSLSASVHP